MIKQIQKSKEKVIFSTDMKISLANAIRRNVNEIPILAINEVDIYKNDSALYDQIIAHRLGLIPLKNLKVKKNGVIEFKLKASGPGEILSKEFGKDVVYEDMPIVFLEKNQEIELVARANQGVGKEHAKYIPGLLHYKILDNIEISKAGERHKELADLYPEIFEFNKKLKLKNAWKKDLSQEDIQEFDGIKITPTNELVFFIESWGQVEAKDIFLEAVKALKNNLSELSKALK